MTLRFCTRSLAALAGSVVLLLAVGPQARATSDPEEPAHVPWTDLLPPLPAGYEPTTENLCVSGQLRCVDVVIREMRRRFDALARRCDHSAVFALTYLRTTEEYRRAIDDPDFFDDTAFVNHEDVVFAAYYFRAFDDWYRNRAPDRVPAAWRVAFDAADRRAVSGQGNLLLGLSAHVNSDLPHVLAAIGLAAPDGSSRKPDHDRVNAFLVRVTQPVLAEIARRFDPTADDGNVRGTTLDETAVFQLVAAWREEAWRNAERLAAARTPAERAAVSQSIEDSAEAKALLLRTQTVYVPPLTDASARDAWCAVHGGDR
ncbi:hypothetical protein BH23ACT7_BH23ACT7_05850 [soil metagenome]